MFTAGGQPYRLQNRAVRGGGGKGGGGQSAPPQPRTFVDPVDGTVFTESPYESMLGGGVNPDGTPRKTAAEQYNEHVAARRAQEQQTSATNTAQAAADKSTAHNTWLGQRDTAYNNALTNVQQTFRDAGLDPAQYMDTYINPALNTAKGSIMEDSPNPASAFTNTLGSDILNNVTTGKRTQAETAFNNVFGPNYTNTLLPDTGLGGYTNTILDEQFNPVKGQLENAYKRGTLDPIGYQGALTKFNEARTGAEGTVSGLARSILNEDRGFINDIVGGGRTTLAGLKPSQAFDPGTYDTQARERAAAETGTFGGELRTKVGDSKFITLSDLINAGGAAQGPINTAPLVGAGGPIPSLYDEDKNKARGLGSTGAF